MKSREEIMNMLEAFDLCRSLRGAGELAGVSHHTVARYVAERDAGELAGGGPQRRERIIDPWLPKIEEWVERSHAKIRADRAFDKLKALGFTGSDRTVRRAVAEVKANHRRGRRRVYRPWIPEPGMWAQWDWGAGPVIAGRRTNLFCAWLAWSRFRVVIATWDRTLPTVIACVDRAMRAFGGPTNGITPLLSQTAAGRQPGRTPWQSQPKRQAIHEPTRPTTYRTLRPQSHTDRILTYKSAVQNAVVGSPASSGRSPMHYLALTAATLVRPPSSTQMRRLATARLQPRLLATYAVGLSRTIEVEVDAGLALAACECLLRSVGRRSARPQIPCRP